ncbi:hypothetical protein [Candidatus Amarolinea dominans]|uniref:hypothetical protein n=1 Tax=Candidatus Amarolinea dominans TaxID=3140696 RepID=UPI001DF32693|nr:hypothetical protein [Anaerolineae bacterium]MBK7203098.1 hypothetical protein [Anaerolineae bacterium]MBK9233627.1 hypothetical protein [Anaerolineae bacterium]
MTTGQQTGDIANKIEDIARSITTHETNITRFEREKNDKIRDYDQLISRERNEIKRLQQLIADLKRQM